MAAEMQRMMDQANRAFADFDSLFRQDDAWARLPASPSMTMRESADSYEVALDMAGADPEQLQVRLDGRLLSVSSHQDTRTRNASSSQRFSSRLLLPGPVEPDALLQITNQAGRTVIRVPKPNASGATVAASANP